MSKKSRERERQLEWEREQGELAGEQKLEELPSVEVIQYVIESARTLFELYDNTDGPTLHDDDILTIDLVSKMVFIYNLRSNEHQLLPGAEVYDVTPVAPYRARLHINNGSFSGDYFVPKDAEPLDEIPFSKKQVSR